MLYDKDHKPTDDAILLHENAGTEKEGPSILYSEFEKALQELKNGKAAGSQHPSRTTESNGI